MENAITDGLILLLRLWTNFLCRGAERQLLENPVYATLTSRHFFSVLLFRPALLLSTDYICILADGPQRCSQLRLPRASQDYSPLPITDLRLQNFCVSNHVHHPIAFIARAPSPPPFPLCPLGKKTLALSPSHIAPLWPTIPRPGKRNATLVAPMEAAGWHCS